MLKMTAGTNAMKGQRGLMMLEVLIALLIFTVGVLGMVKMQAVSTANSVNSEDRATAALLANDLIAELWAAKSAAKPGDFTSWNNRVGKLLPSGDGSASTFVGTTATIVITWNRHMGINMDAGASATELTKFQQATYATQVLIPAVTP
jgi:type IV pilus assembly protein PilV